MTAFIQDVPNGSMSKSVKRQSQQMGLNKHLHSPLFNKTIICFRTAMLRNSVSPKLTKTSESHLFIISSVYQ
jgi:hypothetical protein